MYKNLNRWLQPPSSDKSSSILLKILERQPIETTTPTPTNSETSNQSTTSSSSSSGSGVGNQHTSSTSLRSKILKKFGVSHQSSTTVSAAAAAVNQNGMTGTATTTGTNPSTSYRYVDVKLPKQQQMNNLNSPQQQQPQQQQQRRNSFDPNVQKSYVYTTIMEREGRLKKQREQVQLIDEMIRETEKKSRVMSSDLITAGTTTTNNLTSPNQVSFDLQST